MLVPSNRPQTLCFKAAELSCRATGDSNLISVELMSFNLITEAISISIIDLTALCTTQRAFSI